MTTTNLNKPRVRWYELSTPTLAVLAIFALLLFAAVVGRVRSLQQAPAVPTPALAYVLIATTLPSPVPTAVPLPTPDTRVLEELAALRAQVAQLQAAQQAPPQPEVVYIQAPAAQPVYVEQAAPTPAPYTVANEPPPAPQQAAILDRGQWAVMAATAKAGR